MKKKSVVYIIVFCALLGFNSCKKSSSTDIVQTTVTSSMKLTSNSTALNFNTCVALTASVGSSSQTVITGYNLTGTQMSANSFEVDLMQDLSTITAGQTFPASTSFGQAKSSALFYFPNNNDEFVTQPGNPQGTVTITAVSATSISGTFSGKLFSTTDFDGTNVLYTITGGSFTAKIGNK